MSPRIFGDASSDLDVLCAASRCFVSGFAFFVCARCALLEYRSTRWILRIFATLDRTLRPNHRFSRRRRRIQRTALGWGSSSTGYHFWAFWLACGIVLSPFPNFFVWPVADMLADVTKEDLEKKLGRLSGRGVSTGRGGVARVEVRLSRLRVVMGCVGARALPSLAESR